MAVNQLQGPAHTIKCFDASNYTYMRSLFEIYCRPQFRVDLVVGTRCKKVAKGRCVWTCHYSVVNGNITTPQAFKDTVDILKCYKPYGSEVAGFGRYTGNHFGLFIAYENRDCTCHASFEFGPRPQPLPYIYKHNNNLPLWIGFKLLEEESGGFDDQVLIDMLDIARQGKATEENYGYFSNYDPLAKQKGGGIKQVFANKVDGVHDPMAKQKGGGIKQVFANKVGGVPTGDAIPTPESVPARKTSMIQPYV